MAGALVFWFGFRRRKTDRGANRDPVGVLTRDVVAVNDIDGEYLVGPVAHAGLESRADGAWNIRRTRLPERLDRPLQGLGELPVKARAIEQIMPVGHAVPPSAAVEVDPHVLRAAVRQPHDREGSQVFAGRRVERAGR